MIYQDLIETGCL